MSTFQVRFISSITELGKRRWNAITGIDYPFTRYEFLEALEATGATSARTGWSVSHAVVEADGQAIAVLPLYLKTHSYGEYVFDFAWAEAWQRHGLAYYPKLVAAIPFTPVTGPRLCVLPGADIDRVSLLGALLEALDLLMQRRNASSWHLLFPEDELAEQLSRASVMQRIGVQFHWFNRDYHSFDDFLARFTSRKRKAVRKERNSIQSQGLKLQSIAGDAISEQLWDYFFAFYQSTYARRSGHGGYLNREFFRRIATTMPEHLVLVMAWRDDQPVAGALSFRDSEQLYGRYWGCIEECDNLHFEACYYQGIDYCIAQGLKRFDSGAQGEHKIQRGFEPVITRSFHGIESPQFTPAVAAFLNQEKRHTDRYLEDTRCLLPFRRGAELG